LRVAGALRLLGNGDAAGRWTADDTRYFSASLAGNAGTGLWDDEGSTLTLFVVSKLTAGSFYSFKFTLKNPLCQQSAQPVCIRARNIEVACARGVSITRRLMDHDLTTLLPALNAARGHATPLLIFQPIISYSSLIHSFPWSGANNTLIVRMATNVPLFSRAFSPRITIMNLLGTLTNQPSINVMFGGDDPDSQSTVPALWNASIGRLIFSVPFDTTPGKNYTATFGLTNKNCQQNAPKAVISIAGGEADGICFQSRDLLQLSSMHCNLPTLPLQILGGPCSGGDDTSGTFTLRNISQSSPYPGCKNSISIEIMSSIQLRYQDKAMIEIVVNKDLAIGMLGGDVVLRGSDADKFFGTNETFTSRGRWAPEMDPPRLLLNVSRGKDLSACTLYTVIIDVINPMTDNVMKAQPRTNQLLQSAQTVFISAKGMLGTLIRPVAMLVDSTESMTLQNTTKEDLAPFNVQRPRFFLKTMSQTSPYPGKDNSLSVTIAANTNLHNSSIIAMFGITEASASDGDIPLSGPDANRFKSLTGRVGFGSWKDCEKALILTPASDLGCSGNSFSISFTVKNPVEAQLCANVFINVTQLNNPIVFSNVADQPKKISITMDQATQLDHEERYGGHRMEGVTWVTPANVYGAMPGDSCPMTVWPAVFLVKNIGQSNQNPCGENIITVTLATNVPIDSQINYPGRMAIMPKIIITRIQGAVQDGLSKEGSKSILLRSYGSTTDDSEYFTDGSTNASGVWQRSPLNMAGQPSLTLYPNPNASSCCLPTPATSKTYFTFSFRVYNPSGPQQPSSAISIMATGIPIIEAAMREDIGPKRPMHISKPEFTRSLISQSSPRPCASSTISVSLQLNVELYARCRPMIVLSELSGLDLSMFSNISSKYVRSLNNTNATNRTEFHRYEVGIEAIGDQNNAAKGLSLFAEWFVTNNTTRSSSMMINITSETISADSTISFQFRVRNGALPFASSMPPRAVVGGITMENSSMTRSVELEFWPITISKVDFEVASMTQSSSYPASMNTLTVTLRFNETLPSLASCDVKILISNLVGACFSEPTLALNGADKAMFKATAVSTNSLASWDAQAKSATLLLSQDLVAKTDYVFSFDVRNPIAGQESPPVSIEVTGVSVAKRAMQKNPNKLAPQGALNGVAADGDPLYVRGLTAMSEFLKKAIGQSSADPGDSNVITMTLQTNVPLTAANPPSAITVSGLRGASAIHGYIPLTVQSTAASGRFTGRWLDFDKQLILDVTQDTLPGMDYVISFNVRNPKQAQSSPDARIDSSGIVIQASKMVAAQGILRTMDDQGVLVNTAEGAKSPMFVLSSKLVKRYAHQAGGSAWPAQQNMLTLKFTPTVDVEPIAGGSVSIIVTGLKGVDKPSGLVTLGGPSAGMFTDCNKHDKITCVASRAQWELSSKKLTMNVLSRISARADVTVTFAFTNSMKGQESPKIGIELVTYVDSHAMIGLSRSRYNCSESVRTLARTKATADQCFQVNASTLLSTEQVVGLSANATNLGNSAVYKGFLTVKQAGDYIFGNIGDAYVDIAIDGKVVSWREAAGNDIKLMNAGEQIHQSQKSNSVFLTKGKHGFMIRMIKQTASYTTTLQALWKTPWQPNSFTRIPDDLFEVELELIQIAPQTVDVEGAFKNSDDVPLLIYRSASFTTKRIGHSSSFPGATNTFTMTIRPQFALTGSKRSTITVSGLTGSMTPDGKLALLDADALFNATARWSIKTGSLILSVAPGQQVLSNADTIIKFDLTNPTTPQAGVSVVHIAADGDVPISASPMLLHVSNATWCPLTDASWCPLRVLPAYFTVATIGHSSSAPFADNTISITIQPSGILNRGRRSTLTIHGLVGSDTQNTKSLPLVMNSGLLPTFTSPFSDLILSFSPGCEFASNKVIIFDDYQTNYTGSNLYSTEGSCKGNSTRITSYNLSTRCATLENKLCSQMGAIQSITVIRGGSGFKSGDASTAPGAPGTGFVGICKVDDSGSVKSVQILQGGSGYAEAAQVFCPSACDTATCGVKSRSGEGAMMVGVVTSDLAALVSGSWNRLSGSLEMRVRGEVNASSPLIMSFTIKNGKTPQTARDVYVMAGGSLPVGSTLLNGSAMAISGLDTTRTALCTCSPSTSSSCVCSTSMIMTGVPRGRPVYSLKAQYQCNSGASLTVKVSSGVISVQQPPSTCKDSCQTYHTLVDWYNVATQVNALANDILPLEVEGNGVSADYCGGGSNLKVVFTLIYSA
jgi:hypothetical protein